MRVGADLRQRLCDQNVEPVETLGRVRRDVVGGFGKERGGCEGGGRGGPEDGGTSAVQVRGGGRGRV